MSQPTLQASRTFGLDPLLRPEQPSSSTRRAHTPVALTPNACELPLPTDSCAAAPRRSPAKVGRPPRRGVKPSGVAKRVPAAPGRPARGRAPGDAYTHVRVQAVIRGEWMRTLGVMLGMGPTQRPDHLLREPLPCRAHVHGHPPICRTRMVEGLSSRRPAAVGHHDGIGGALPLPLPHRLAKKVVAVRDRDIERRSVAISDPTRPSHPPIGSSTPRR